MNILIDNKDLKIIYGIDILNYTGVFGVASERTNERVWTDKSGVDKNLTNVRYESKEFVLECICRAPTEASAYELINTVTTYMFTVGVFVLSIRDSERSIRQAFLCERSNTIVPTINVRQQNSLYYFKIGLKDVNPNAILYKETIIGGEITIAYTKGQNARIYWGNGENSIVSNSQNYTKSDYLVDEIVDIFIDVDKDNNDVASLEAVFSADITSGVEEQTVVFTDNSVGNVIIWAWDFGDGNTSAEQSPTHIYTEAGTYTVTLQVFNGVQGFDSEDKPDYITVRKAKLLINGVDSFLKNATDTILKN